MSHSSSLKLFGVFIELQTVTIFDTNCLVIDVVDKSDILFENIEKMTCFTSQRIVFKIFETKLYQLD